MGPTPWVSTSHPASVSIGGPQFPSCSVSHASAGCWQGDALVQTARWSVKATVLVLRSDRDMAAERPCIRRGNKAKPLFAAAFPTSGPEVNDWKSLVLSSCWLMWDPL